MKLIISLFVAFLALTTFSFAQSCTNVSVVTGYGYLTNPQGQNTSQEITTFTVGVPHTICVPTGYTYTEVANQTALNAIPIYQAPPPPLTVSQQNQAIQKQIHQLQQDEIAQIVSMEISNAGGTPQATIATTSSNNVAGKGSIAGTPNTPAQQLENDDSQIATLQGQINSTGD